MAVPKPKKSKRSVWGGVPKVRCKNKGCKKRVRSYQHLGECNRCVNKYNESLKSNKKKKREKKENV